MVEACLHIHNIQHAKPLLKKFRLIQTRLSRFIISVPKSEVKRANDLFETLNFTTPHTTIGVENKYNDWSGYLALLQQSKSNKLIVCNDSVISRRLMVRRDFQRLFDLLDGAKSSSLIGELDTAKVSVSINGISSPCWISSYMFGLNLENISASELATQLERNCENIPEQTAAYFLNFLGNRRKDLLKSEPLGGGKIIAMHLERLLTDYAIQNEFDIVSMFGGDWNRKFRKLAECVKSA